VRDIVKDLRTFARSDERMGPVDLRQVVESAIKVTRNEIKFRAQLVCDYDDALPPVQANSRLGQVFLNLLMNAAQAIGEGDPVHNRISVEVHARGEWVEVRITDTGVGIAAEQRQKIFDPFYTTKPVGMGTGLGLSICRNIVQSLDGSMDVESEPGRGSSFTVRLPVSRANSSTTIRPGSNPPPVSQRTLRVLIVDDDRLVAKATKRQLSPPHAVTLASSGAEALELTGRQDFDAILCDVMMPGMTGMEFHDRVQQKDPALASRFVFITGGAFTPQARERFSRNNNPHITKPFTTSELIAALEAAISPEVLEASIESA
jgi:CheY-like chemotaxis protein